MQLSMLPYILFKDNLVQRGQLFSRTSFLSYTAVVIVIGVWSCETKYGI